MGRGFFGAGVGESVAGFGARAGGGLCGLGAIGGGFPWLPVGTGFSSVPTVLAKYCCLSRCRSHPGLLSSLVGGPEGVWFGVESSSGGGT